ncbi:MAG: mechanosensitive ion channel family protein [Frankiales bacterium]|nr:mechanosensitive ion channel family protein [Frankiales bacterium]
MRGLLHRYGDDAVTTGLRVLLIVVLAVVVRALLHRLVARLVRGAVEGTTPVVLRPLKERIGVESGPLLSERRRQRAETIGSVLRSTGSGVVLVVAGAMVMSELGLDLGPVLASAGIVGVALGFGAQTLVKDVLTGAFLILEDQFGVGDVVDLGEATGVVEAVGLRTTRLRSVDGTVWYVRNGEVLRVGNMSQGWSRALLDLPVAWSADVPTVRALVKQVADGLWHDPDWEERVLEEPEVWGVEALSPDGVLLRLVVKTVPLQQWAVMRELRERLKAAFDEAGVDVAVPRSLVQHVGTP